jgi:hypothetical protein
LLLDCLDNGIGMSDHELRSAFARVGGRFRDLPEFLEEEHRRRRTDVEPFHPISQFGIGVLSYFMVADRVELWTQRRRAGDGRFHEALHVDIASGGDLLRVGPALPPELPSSAGTRLRFHLHDHISAVRVLESLSETVRAPRVRVRFRNLTDESDEWVWEPGLLYDSHGAELSPCFPVPSLGVYLHPGNGATLVNGIPTSGGAANQGFTISLDGRCRPELSVDRRQLRGYDDAAASHLLSDAVAMAAEWSDVDANWLCELFRGRPAVGLVAFDALRDRRLELRPINRDPNEGHWPGARTIVPSRDGFNLSDPDLLGGISEPAEAVLRVRARQLLSGPQDDGVRPHPGLPAFDERLAVVDALGHGQTSIGGMLDLAENVHVSLGAATAFRWAVNAVERVLPLNFRADASDFFPGESAVWSQLRTITLGLTVLGSQELNSVAREEMPMIEVAAMVVPGLPKLNLAAAEGLSPAATRLWSRDSDGVNPFLTLWSDVVSGAAEALDPGDVEPLRELAPVFGVRAEEVSEVVPTVEMEPGVELFPTGDAPKEWDAELRELLARDNDDAYPYYTRAVPARHVAIVASREGRDVHDLLRLISDAGFEIMPSFDDPSIWDRLVEIVDENPEVFADLNWLSSDGRFELRPGIGSLFGAERRAGWARLQGFATRLTSLEMAGPRLAALPGVELGQAKLPRLFRLFSAAEQVDDNLLVKLAEVLPGGLAEAWDLLATLRPLVDDWRLGQERPTALDGTPLHELASGFYYLLPASDPDEFVRAVTALRLSALEQVPLAAVVDAIKPVCEAANFDLSTLQQLAVALPEPLIFDDLLIMATQLFEPTVGSVSRVVAICEPFAHQRDELRVRASRWISIRPLIGELAKLNTGRVSGTQTSG